MFGIKQGDKLLKEIAMILTDKEKSYRIKYARLGSDLFSITFNENINRIENFLNELKKDINSLSKYFDINLSIGLYKINDKSLSIETMMDYCTQARKTVKKQYVKLYAMYDEEMYRNRINEQKVINRMNQALNNGEFNIYLQPKYDIYENKIIGAEALVRWIKNNEVIPPSEFIPIFERNGFITKLDLYVWEETLKYLKYRLLKLL